MKYFNMAGPCVQDKHYMVDLSSRVDKVIDYIDQGKYIDQHSPGQTGKTGFMFAVNWALKDRYLVIHILLGCAAWKLDTEAIFISFLSRSIHKELKKKCSDNIVQTWERQLDRINLWNDLNYRITELCEMVDREVVLIMDECDHVLFSDPMIKLLALLRDKFQKQQRGEDHTFKSVVVSSKYSTKGLKLKNEPDDENYYTDPWSIAVSCEGDVYYNENEIRQMLEEYRCDRKLHFDTSWFAKQIYEFTSGYPYYVSRICMIMDEEVKKENGFDSLDDVWTERGFQKAIDKLLRDIECLYYPLDDMFRENEEFQKLLHRILIEKDAVPFDTSNRLIYIGYFRGWFKNDDGKTVIANRVYERLICDHIQAKQFYLTLMGLKEQS